MKQISQNYKTGAIHLEDINAPVLQPGGVLVPVRNCPGERTVKLYSV